MANTNNFNNTPDSWDQNDSGGFGDPIDVNQLSKPMSELNVEAPSFVPGLNYNAKEFVPSFATTSSDTSQNTADSAPTHESMEVEENTSVTPPDDWETSKDASTCSTPSEESDKGGGATVKAAAERVKRYSETEVKKDHVNVVFIGHVDAGKSTIGGHIMYLTGMVDKRTLEKYEREAKEKNRETWYLSWALDTNTEERDKGKTVEVGRAYFETETKHFTILDAPGHRSFVPNMIGGASQADLAVLVISARKGEFETGFERGGQTREHAMLVKTAGVKKLVVAINKMDDPTVNWDETRYTECKDKLIPYLKKCGFNPKTDIHFLPVSGITGAFLKEPDPQCKFYDGPPLLTYLNDLPLLNRNSEGPLRLPIVDRYKDMGTIIQGKVESGTVKKMSYLLMPNRMTVEVMQLWSDEIETDVAESGANVKVKLKGVEEEDVSPGFVLCSPENVCNTSRVFDAQIVILEYKNIICAGYSAILHIHTCAEEVTIKSLLCTIDKKTGKKSPNRPRFVKQDQIAIARFEVHGGMICMETFKDFPQMGRFTLRDEGKSIAIGKVLKIRE
ncbi:unnamed protein product [Owenia fusiformis]|uniref:Tr-type G domain-containing protein n=1 Tax=Owenia fusiformis TaxID=6347 RepID=A0A8J1U6Y5_OWEFU|nr:unnamed protein product [Owenia fusiformis]